MKKIIFLLIIAVLSLLGCSYSVYQNNYPHLKKIQVHEFVNSSSEYELEINFQNSLIKNFNQDKVLKTVTKKPDCSLEGTILDYEKRIRSFDDTTITEYEVRILLNVKLIDLKKNEVLYEKKSEMISQAYSNNQENATLPKNEEEAQEKIFQTVYDDIVDNVFQAW